MLCFGYLEEVVMFYRDIFSLMTSDQLSPAKSPTIFSPYFCCIFDFLVIISACIYKSSLIHAHACTHREICMCTHIHTCFVLEFPAVPLTNSGDFSNPVIPTRGIQSFGLSGPYWKKTSCLGPHIKYTMTCNDKKISPCFK